MAAQASSLGTQQCETILRDGVFDKVGEFEASASLSSFGSWLCRSGERSEETAALRAALEGVDLRWFSFASNAFGQGDGFAATRRRFCGRLAQQQTGSPEFREFARQGVEVLEAARQQCVERPGFHAWLSGTTDQDQFRLHVRWNPREGDRSRASIVPGGLATSNLNCRGPIEGVPFGEEGRSFDCQRQAPGPFFVSLQSTQGTSVSRGPASPTVDSSATRLELQSSHPAQSGDQPLLFHITHPGARSIRLHFRRVDPQSAETAALEHQRLEIATPGEPAQFEYDLNVIGLWSRAIQLGVDSTAELRLHCRSACWGFEIDRYEVVE